MATEKMEFQYSNILIERSKRKDNSVYFIRFHAHNIQVDEFLKRCILKADLLLDGHIQPPDVNHIKHYQEIQGDSFTFARPFFHNAFAHWMPNINMNERTNIANAIYSSLKELEKIGKNANVIRNTYIKYMCWIQEIFNKVIASISNNHTPLILCYCDVSIYELQMLDILNRSGCDVILISPNEANYKKIDSDDQYSQKIQVCDGEEFTEEFKLDSWKQREIDQPPAMGGAKNVVLSESDLKSSSQKLSLRTDSSSLPSSSERALYSTSAGQLRTFDKPVSIQMKIPSRPGVTGNVHSVQHGMENATLGQNTQSSQPAEEKLNSSHTGPVPVDFGPEPKLKLNFNNWFVFDDPFKNILLPIMNRSPEGEQLCNAYIQINGVKDKSTYENELFQFYKKLSDSGRKVVLIEKTIKPPSPDEISRIRRGQYRYVEDMVRALSVNISTNSPELQKYLVRAFGEVVFSEAKKSEMNLNRVTNLAVYLLCWLNRLQKNVFSQWSAKQIPCLIFFEACKGDKDAAFIKMLGRLPVDVLVLNPNLNNAFMIEDKIIHTVMQLESIVIEQFPKNMKNVMMTTEGYQAERELENELAAGGSYNCGLIKRVLAHPIYTSFGEVAEFWSLELRERPGYEVIDNVANFPVLFSKFSGVSHEKEEDYWRFVKEFITPETFVIRGLPFATNNALSPISMSARELVRNGKLQRDRIKSHRQYPYSLIRYVMQEHILDTLQEMLDRKIIISCGANDSEWMVFSAVFSLKIEIQRLIQQFDFVHLNPKIVVLNPGETMGTLQDAIQLAFLNMFGFDVLIFEPSGYQCVEQWYSSALISEHKLGNYQYHYKLEVLDALNSSSRKGLFGLFRRS